MGHKNMCIFCITCIVLCRLWFYTIIHMSTLILIFHSKETHLHIYILCNVINVIEYIYISTCFQISPSWIAPAASPRLGSNGHGAVTLRAPGCGRFVFEELLHSQLHLAMGIQCHGGDKSGLMNGNEMIYCISMCMSEKKVYPVNL